MSGRIIPFVSVNSQTAELTDIDYRRMAAFCPADTDVTIEVWAAWLTQLLGRAVDVAAAQRLIEQFNARLRRELL